MAPGSDHAGRRPDAGRDPTPDELARGVRELLSDLWLDIEGVPDSLRDTIFRQVYGASTARLGLLTADAPFASLLTEGRLAGHALVELDGEWRDVPFEMRRAPDTADRFRLSLTGLPIGLDPLALKVGDLQLGSGARGLTGSLRIPLAWLPASVDPMAAFARPSSRDVSRHTAQARFDDRSEREERNPVEIVFLEQIRQLQVTAPVRTDQDEDAVIAEVTWPLAGDRTRKDVQVVRLARNPHWPQHARLRRGVVELNVPADVRPGEARIVIRNLVESDLPKRLEAAFGGRGDLTDLPLIAGSAGFEFRVRDAEEHAALAAAGHRCLIELASAGREGGRP